MSYLRELGDARTDITSGELLTLLQRAAAELVEWRRKAIERLSSTVTISVVETVGDLPSSASARHWFRVRTGTLSERAAIYVGNGSERPLTKLTPGPI